MKTDVLIVGAGFSGATMAERIASQLGLSVLIIDQRSHIGGNVYDEADEHGVWVHRYGPHLFHTSDKRVWDYVQGFGGWQNYEHRVRARIDGQSVPLPFNLNSIEQLFPAQTAQKLSERLLETFGYGNRVPILKLIESKDKDLENLASVIYEKVFLHYTEKQWGVKPEELSAGVTGRVPVLVSRDNRYFQDQYQAMPTEGYSKIVSRMLNHQKIRILLQTSFEDIREEIDFKFLVYTGSIDTYFKDEFGTLAYRTLRFDYEHFPTSSYQDVAVVNYPNDNDFTRITEFKKMTGQDISSTTIIKEYPGNYVRGKNIPYYPMMTQTARKLYQRYEQKAKTLENVIFLGRLARYEYINMDIAIRNALSTFDRFAKQFQK